MYYSALNCKTHINGWDELFSRTKNNRRAFKVGNTECSCGLNGGGCKGSWRLAARVVVGPQFIDRNKTKYLASEQSWEYIAVALAECKVPICQCRENTSSVLCYNASHKQNSFRILIHSSPIDSIVLSRSLCDVMLSRVSYALNRNVNKTITCSMCWVVCVYVLALCYPDEANLCWVCWWVSVNS